VEQESLVAVGLHHFSVIIAKHKGDDASRVWKRKSHVSDTTSEAFVQQVE
jgi:hypothetical protein